MKRNELKQLIKEEIQSLLQRPIMMVDLEPGVYKIDYKYSEYRDGETSLDSTTLDFTPEIINSNSDLSIQNYMKGVVDGLVSVRSIDKLK